MQMPKKYEIIRIYAFTFIISFKSVVYLCEACSCLRCQLLPVPCTAILTMP